MSLDYQYKIVNLVASTRTGNNIDLSKLYNNCDNAEYDPEFYHALKYKTQKPKATILVIKTGKIIICGVKTVDEVIYARDHFYLDLRKIGYYPIKNKIKIENFVFCSDIKQEIDLKSISLKVETDFDPKRFPGFIYRNNNPKFTAIIFRSGKYSVTGLKNFNDISKTIKIVKTLIKS